MAEAMTDRPTSGTRVSAVMGNLRERIAELARDLDLNEFLDRANGKLSAGQKTRVALAKALINRPELLLLDEPTASLDPDTADWVRAHLETYRKTHDATILLASVGEEVLANGPPGCGRGTSSRRHIWLSRGEFKHDDRESPADHRAHYGGRHVGAFGSAADVRGRHVS